MAQQDEPGRGPNAPHERDESKCISSVGRIGQLGVELAQVNYDTTLLNYI